MGDLNKLADNFEELIENDGCISCEEDPEPDNPIDVDNYKCPKSKRPCGHHCNHAWSHEECCWCGMTFGDDNEN